MMTRTTKEEINGSALYFLKKVHLIITILVIILTQLAFAFSSYYALKQDINNNFMRIDNHIQNPDIHMSYANKVEEFVPRGEFTDLKENIEEIKSRQKRIEDKLDRLILKQ